jgi:hypothetical protein
MQNLRHIKQPEYKRGGWRVKKGAGARARAGGGEEMWWLHNPVTHIAETQLLGPCTKTAATKLTNE